VIAENDNLKRSVASQSKCGSGDSVTMQAMQNQITILEKENEFLRKKLKHILPTSSSPEETEAQKTSISETEMAELRALEMIRKLLDSVQKHHGQSGRVQEALKELSAKKLKTLHASTCKKLDCDITHMYSNGNSLLDETDTVKSDTKRKNSAEMIADVKRYKGISYTDTSEEVK